MTLWSVVSASALVPASSCKASPHAMTASALAIAHPMILPFFM
jgi:hypothetical protein